MGILFVLIILIVPYMWGCFITGVSKDKDACGLSVYVQGILSIFILSLGVILFALKSDMKFASFTIIETVILLMGTVLGIPFCGARVKSGKAHFVLPCRKDMPILIPAVLIGAFSIILTARSFVNDATVEIVRTTLSTGDIYVYSSLTGQTLEKGLPIFNKVLVTPMLYGVLSKISFTDISLITGLLVPVLTYVLNLSIMWKISSYAVKEENRKLFMYSHMLLLIAGTAIPKMAIPVSQGFTLLRQGFTGYTWAFCVAVPFAAWMLLEKKYVRAIYALLSLAGLLKLDSIFFAAKDFSNSYHSMGASCKLWIIYLAAVLYGIYAACLYKKKFSWELLLCGTAFISASVMDFYERLDGSSRKERYTFLAWMVLAYLACVSFKPFGDVSFNLSPDGLTKSQKEAVEVLENWDISSPAGEDGRLVIGGNSEVLDAVRKSTGDIKTAYGRNFWEPMLTGYEYEDYSFGQLYLMFAVDGINSEFKLYDENETLVYLDGSDALYDTDVVVLDKDVNLTNMTLMGFDYFGFDTEDIISVGDYKYLHK